MTPVLPMTQNVWCVQIWVGVQVVRGSRPCSCAVVPGRGVGMHRRTGAAPPGGIAVCVLAAP